MRQIEIKIRQCAVSMGPEHEQDNDCGASLKNYLNIVLCRSFVVSVSLSSALLLWANCDTILILSFLNALTPY